MPHPPIWPVKEAGLRRAFCDDWLNAAGTGPLRLLRTVPAVGHIAVGNVRIGGSDYQVTLESFAD